MTKNVLRIRIEDQMRARGFAQVMFAFCLLFFSQAWSETEAGPVETGYHRVESSQPNIVLLFVDDLGWNDLGFRNSKFETPHIDQLASDSLDFQRAYIASPTCSPSRATLLTGKHPARLKIVRHIPTGTTNGFDKFGRTEQEFNQREGDPAKFPCRNWLPLEHTTYAEALKKLGYYNQFVGKWHLGHEPYHPIKQGFDAQFGTTNFGHPKSYMAPFFKNSDVLADVREGHLTDVLTKKSVNFISEYDRDQPFMLSLWYYGVHRPPVGRPDLLKHFQEKGYEKKDAIYAAQVAAVDDSVGRIRMALKEKGIEKETLIVFLSDQGSWYKNLPLRGSKRVDTLCEGGARVPFLFNWPGVTKSKSHSDSLVQSTDLFPTLVEIAGGDVASHQDLDGVSLVSHIRDQKPLARKSPIFGYRAYQDLYASVREGDWNLLAYRSGKVALHNVIKDVGEEHDVASENAEVVSDLSRKLIAWEKEMGVQKYSGLKEIEFSEQSEFKHLFGAKLLLNKIKTVEPTEQQLNDFNRLSRQYTEDVMALRESVGIDITLIKKRDKAYRPAVDSGLKGDELWLKVQQEAGLTDEQREAFRKTNKRSNQFKTEVKKILTSEQRSNLPRGKKSSKK